MITDLEKILSSNVKKMKRSPIRELLKLTARPNIISFAGGLPSPQSFPVDDLKQVMQEVMETESALALQYGTTEGDNLLRTMLVNRANAAGMNISLENLIVTTASQQGLDLIAKILFDPGNTAIVGLPSYLGGLSAFNSYGAELHGVPLDEHGEDPNIMEDKIKTLTAKGKKPKFIYIIPDFQNPAGITMPEWRRREIIALAHKYDILILEDSPYRELRYEGKHQRTIYELDGTGQVVLLGTFSKIFCPGFRIGWVIGHPEILDRIVMGKQSTDLCSPAFTQRVAGRYMEKGLLDKNIRHIVSIYREKQKDMLAAMEEYMPKCVTWTHPQGGLFMMATCPEHMDMTELLKQAILEEEVAYVAGESFYCDGSGKNTMRINFSYETIEKNRIGMQRLGRFLAKHVDKCN